MFLWLTSRPSYWAPVGCLWNFINPTLYRLLLFIFLSNLLLFSLLVNSIITIQHQSFLTPFAQSKFILSADFIAYFQNTLRTNDFLILTTPLLPTPTDSTSGPGSRRHRAPTVPFSCALWLVPLQRSASYRLGLSPVQPGLWPGVSSSLFSLTFSSAATLGPKKAFWPFQSKLEW